MNKFMHSFVVTVTLAIALLLSLESNAQRAPKELGERGSKLWESEVVLFEGNGSYYQLISDFTRDNSGATWEDARSLAAERTYKGRHGRLAMLDSAELQNWVLGTFDLPERGYNGNTWIGIRYWCSFRKLTDIDGATYSFQSFSAWDTPWYRDGGTRCEINQKLPYMGVYIQGTASRWRAAGFLKRYPNFLVEYPAPTSDTAQSTND